MFLFSYKSHRHRLMFYAYGDLVLLYDVMISSALLILLLNIKEKYDRQLYADHASDVDELTTSSHQSLLLSMSEVINDRSFIHRRNYFDGWFY